MDTKPLAQCITVISLIPIISLSNVFPVNISNDSYSSSSIIPSTPRQLLCIGPHQLHLLTIHTPESTRRQIIRHLFVNTKQRENKKIVRGISSSTRCAQVNKGTYYRYFGTLFNNSILRIKASPSYDFKHRPSSFEQPYPYGKDLEIGSLTRSNTPGELLQTNAWAVAGECCTFVAWPVGRSPRLDEGKAELMHLQE